MSRRALEHQQMKAVKRQEARMAAGIAIPTPPSEDPEDTFPYKCDPVTMDLGHVLYSNIVESPYFRDNCAELTTFDEVVDEIYSYVDHLGRSRRFHQQPNAALLSLSFSMVTDYSFTTKLAKYRVLFVISGKTSYEYNAQLFCMRLTEADLDTLVTHKDSVYIRAIGFLYLRYTADADTLWTWYQDFIDDPEPVKVKMPTAAPQMPIGQYLRMLLTDQQYLHPVCRLPRIPVLQHRDILDELKRSPYDPRRFTGELEEEKNAPQPSAPGYLVVPGSSQQVLLPPPSAIRFINPYDNYDERVSSRGRRRSRSRSRSRSRYRDRSRSRSPHSRSPDHRRRDRDRDRSRSRSRHRSRRSRRYRTPSRSRSRSPSRSRSRSKSRDRSSRRHKRRDRKRTRSRSRSRDRKRTHSRSRSRDREGRRASSRSRNGSEKKSRNEHSKDRDDGIAKRSPSPHVDDKHE
eukprot:gene5309-7081_t